MTTAEILRRMEADGAVPVGGGTTFVGGAAALPERFVSVRLSAELRKAEKWDRSLSLGPSLTLSELEDKGERNLPPLLHRAIRATAGRFVRNVATLGGNIFAERHGSCGTLVAPLAALDARLEFSRAGDIRAETRTVPLSRLGEFDRRGWLLTRVRVPNEEWDVQVFRRLGPAGRLCADSASFAFLADAQDGSLAAVRVAFAGAVRFRSAELESRLVGSPAPLPSPLMDEVVSYAGRLFDETASGRATEIARAQFLRLLKNSLERIR